MSAPEPNSAEQDRLEEIVAYLDGELSPQQSAEIERRMTSDDDYRVELQSVDRAWAALDELPRATVDDNFSRTTIEMVVSAAQEQVDAQTLVMPKLRRRRRVSALLVGLAAAACGFAAFALVWDDPNEQLLADLPVIQNLDVYRQFEDVEFLNQLHEQLGVQLEELAKDSPELEARVRQFQTVADASPVDRAAWLKDSPEEQKKLRAKYNQFLALSDSQQQRIRDLHVDVVTADNAPELQRTMLLYRHWLDGQSPGHQYELRTNEPKERLEEIGKSMKEQQCNVAFKLDNAELRKLYNSIRDGLPEQIRRKAFDRRGGGGPPGDRSRPDGPQGERRRIDRLNYDAFEQDFKRKDNEWPLHDAVVEGLPADAQQLFKELSAREKVERLKSWMGKYRMMSGEISQQELERYYTEELDPETREQLLQLSPEELQRTLRRLITASPEQQPFGWQGGGRGNWGNRRDRGGDRGGDRENRTEGRGVREGEGRRPGPGEDSGLPASRPPRRESRDDDDSRGDD